MSVDDHGAHNSNLAKQSGATVPTNGGIYWLQNLKYSHFFNVARGSTQDGTIVIAWKRQVGKNERVGVPSS